MDGEMVLTERSKALYQPWNQEGFTSDLFVRKMTNVQRWIYKTLLQEAFVCSTRPRLPNDDDLLWMMADCESKEQWLENKQTVLKMFEVSGDLLVHSRLEEDWDRIQDIRGSRAAAGKKGGLAKAKQMLDSAKQNVASKEVSEVREEKQEEILDLFFQDDGQGDEMRTERQIEILTQQFFNKKAYLRGRNGEDLKTLVVQHKGSAVERAYGGWCRANQENPDIQDPVAVFLEAADELLGTESPARAAAKDPEVVSLVRELSYLSGGQISFMDKQRVRLAEVLKEFSAVEIKESFAAWFGDQDTSDTKNLSFLPGKFVQIVDGLAYSARKRKEESEKAQTAREAAVKKIQAEAEEERKKHEEERRREEETPDQIFG